MTKRKYIYILVLLAVCLPVLLSCSDDSETENALVKVEVIPCAPSFVEVSPITTRAWNPPTGYYLYNDEYVNGPYIEQANLINNTIGVFFTQDGSSAPKVGSFFYDNSDEKWRSTVEINSGTYYLYGFIPYESGVIPSISGTFSTGATLTLQNMPTVTPSDVCVVVGAKNGNSPEDDNGLTTAQFEYVTEGTTNHVFLLFDHLYSALNLKVRVAADYYKLRRIKLKEMKLKPYNGETASSDKTTVTVTLASNNNNSSPITGVSYTPVGTGGNPMPLYQSETGIDLGTDYTPIRCCFTPGGITKFILVSKYDVYDRKGNLIRKDCTAENVINMSLFSETTQMERGRIYTLYLTVEPTYLYVLSDPDLDNPTLVID